MYRRVLSSTDFRRLWLGATVSTLGDGMTWVALTWLVVSRSGGAGQLGLLAVCYTAPVVVGGLAVGPLLDRFDKRVVLAADSVLRAGVVATIPLTVALDAMPTWLPFVVAGVHGFLKMIPLGGFPAAIAQLVDDEHLDAANGLESVSYSVAGVVGPALAGVLITQMDAANVLLVDSVSFLVFALAAAAVRRPLRPAPVAGEAADRKVTIARLRRDRVIVATTVAFMAFNIAEGMLLVTAPWLADTRLPHGAAALGLLLSAMAAGELIGATMAGARHPRRAPVRAIGIAQVVAACGFLALLASPHQVVIAVGFFAIGALSGPMTVWAQSLRMRRIPPSLHGRAFATLRTLILATPPIGAALVTPLLARGQLTAAAFAMLAIGGLPGLYLIARSELAQGAAVDGPLGARDLG